MSAGRLLDAAWLAGMLLPALVVLFALFRGRPSTAFLGYDVLLVAASKFAGASPAGEPLLSSELPLLVLAMVIVADHHLLLDPPPLSLPRYAVARSLLAHLHAEFGPGVPFSLAVTVSDGPVWLRLDLRPAGKALRLDAEERHARAGSPAGGEGAVRVGRFRFSGAALPEAARVRLPPGAMLEPESSADGVAVFSTLRDYHARPDGLGAELARAARDLAAAG